MKLIIAGGRNYRFTMTDVARLHALKNTHEITEVVSGGATGADAEGERWAELNSIPVKRFPADWNDLSQPRALIRRTADGKLYDARAGFRRNQAMAEYADACVLFPGGSGTADMAGRAAQQAQRREFKIFDWRKR